MSTQPTSSTVTLPTPAPAVVPGSATGAGVLGGGGGLVDMTPAVPAPVAGALAAPVGPPGLPAAPVAAPVAADGTSGAADAQTASMLGTLLSMLTQLIASTSGQPAAAGAMTAGGGAAAAPATGANTISNAPFTPGNLGGGASLTDPRAGLLSPNTILSLGSAGVLGGGGGLAQPSPTAPVAVLGGGGSLATPTVSLAAAGSGVIGGGGSMPSYGDATRVLPGAATSGGGVMSSAAPTVSAPAAAAPVFDTRRLVGTPQPGGAIDVVIRSGNPTAGASRSEGAWTTLTDGNGAQLQAHVHGAWSSHPDRIVEGIQRGFIQVHVHPDGTLHLHDIA